MDRDTRVRHLEFIFSELLNHSGKFENTSIYTGAEVINDAYDVPNNRILVRGKDGYYHPALTIPGAVYNNGDVVSVLYVKGTEPIAMQQSPGSAGSALPQHDHSSNVEGGQDLHQIEELEFEDAAELTIDGAGAVTRTQVYHSIDTNGDAATDNLDTINGGVEGDLLIIRAENSARTVVVRHNVGNIWLLGGADISLEDAEYHLIFIYDGSMWCSIGDGGGAGGGGGGGYPFTVTTIDAVEPTADFATLPGAIAAGSVGEIFKVGPGTYDGYDMPIVVADLLPQDAELGGQRPLATTIVPQGAAEIAFLLYNYGNKISDIRFEASGTNYTGCIGTFAASRSVDGMIIRCCSLETDASGLGTGTGFGIEAGATGDAYSVFDTKIYVFDTTGTHDLYGIRDRQSGTVVLLYDLDVIIEAYGGDGYGVYANPNSEFHIFGGRYEVASSSGNAYALYASAGATIYLHNLPTLVGDLGGAGTFVGVYQDDSGIVYDAEAIHYTPDDTKMGWDTPPDDVAEAFDEIAKKIGHIMQGGHPANPYPNTPNDDDAEFNNTNQSDNNTIGTHAAGDFWELQAGADAPDAVNINTTTLNCMYVKVNTDNNTVIYEGDIAASGEDDHVWFEVAMLPNSNQENDDCYFALWLYDSVSSNYVRIKLNKDATNGEWDILCLYDIGGGEVTKSTFVVSSPFLPGLTILGIRRYESGGNAYARWYFGFEGVPVAQHFGRSDQVTLVGLGAKANFVPDELWLEFHAGVGGGSNTWHIDSVRRIA